MAYNIKYYSEWKSKETQGHLYIDELDGVDPSTSIQLSSNGIQIEYAFNDWNHPIVKLNASISILNDKDDFYELLPLLTNVERQFRLRILNDDSGIMLFEGFINTATVSEKYRTNRPIKLTASNYLSKLVNLSPTLINTIQKNSIIDVLNETIKLTGKTDDIRVNFQMYPTGISNGTGQTAFNRTGFDSEVFWKNNIEKESGLKILERTLTPFDTYLYWYNQKWYIERYEDLYNNTLNYVEYSSDVSYGYSDSALDVSVNDPSTDIQSLSFLGEPTLSFIPGLKTIEVKYDAKEYGNLTIPMAYDSEYLTTEHRETVELDYRTWKFSDHPTWTRLGNFNQIEEAVHMADGDSTGFGPYTRFKVTIDPSLNTSLNLNWKVGFPAEGIYEPTDTYKFSPDDFSYDMAWWIRDNANTYYLSYDSDNSRWYRHDNPTLSVDAIQHLYYEGTELDPVTFVGDLSATINLADPSVNLSGDIDLIFGIGNPLYVATVTEELPLYAIPEVILGDVVITASQDKQNNLIVGDVNNGFLNKETISADIFDVSNLNYKNGIYTGSEFITRTETWTDGSTNYPLTHRLIQNKFQLYNETRQKLSGAIKSSTHIKPFAMYYDASQGNKQFLLTSYSYTPMDDVYDCEWLEYDNTTTVNIIEE